MKKNYKLLLVIIGVVLIITFCVSSSYAFWKYSATQNGEHIIESKCFEIVYEDENDINLTNAVPLTDEEGKELIPYTFKLKNKCDVFASFIVTLETLKSSNIDTQYIKYQLNNYNSYILSSAAEESYYYYVNKDAYKSNIITAGYLEPGMEKTFDLRLWISEDAGKRESSNKTYSSKVVVNSSLITGEVNGYLVEGYKFNNIIRRIAGDTNYLPNYISHFASSYYGEYNILRIEKSNELPSDDFYVVNVSGSREVPVLAWFDNGTIKLYSPSLKISFPSYARQLFAYLSNLEYIDLSAFDTSDVYSYEGLFEGDLSLNHIDLSELKTNTISDMSYMFSETGFTTLDLSSFDTSKVTNMSRMFSNSKSLKTIYVSDKWNTNKVNSSYDIFYNCTSLVGGAGTAYNSSYSGLEYARIDDPDNGKPGHFTLKTN